MLNVISAQLEGGAPAVTNSYESIATFTATGSSNTITFSSIPSTYKHLQIRGLLKNTNGGAYDDPTYLQFNGDTGSNYNYHSVYGNGSGANAFNGSGTQIVAYGTPANNFTDIWGAAIIDILDYTDTNKNTTTRWMNAFDANGSGSINFASGLWRNTAAVTSISLITSGGNWANYSSFALYGIKG